MSQPVYKDVSVDATAFTPEQVERAVQAICDTFLPADLYLTVQFPTVTLHLNQLDVRLLRTALTQADNVPRELAELLCGAVEAIKSYGVKNGKRHFSDYNAERKVVNRKQKEADRSRLLRALGQEDEPRLDAHEEDLGPGTHDFLLCSDGFWEYVLEKEMARALRRADSPHEALEHMLERLRGRAPKDNDNYTAVLVRVRIGKGAAEKA